MKVIKTVVLGIGIFLCLPFSSIAAVRAATWNAIGPSGGKVSAIAIAPTNSQIVYAASVSGGVFKSTDGGENWIQAANGIDFIIISTLAIDPQNSSIIYAASGFGGDGAFKSNNGGASWSPTGPMKWVSNLVIDPSSPSTLYAATEESGLWKTIDGGAAWNQINAGLDSLFLVGIAIDSQSPSTLYVSGLGGLYKTTDGGMNWVNLNKNIQERIALDPRSPSIIYSYGDYNSLFFWPFGSLSKSSDGGLTFQVIPVPFPVLRSPVGGFAISPGPDGTLFAGTTNGVYRSFDGGATWTSGAFGLGDPKVITLAVDPTNPANVFAGTYLGGLFKSRNRGASWEASNKGLTGLAVYSLAVDPDNAMTVYAGAGGGPSGSGTILKTTNGGLSWEPKLSDTAAFCLAVDPKNPLVVYEGGMGNSAGGGIWGIAKSINGGESWAGVKDTKWTYGFDLAIDPQNTSVVYAALSEGCFKSIDGGVNWTSLYAPSWRLAIDSLNPSTVYAADIYSVSKSMDGGVTWAPLGAYSIPAIDPSSSSTIYAFSKAGLHKSTDGGASWTLKTNGLPAVQWSGNIVIDPITPSTLYCVINGNVYRSLDGAENWVFFSDGIPAGTATDLACGLKDISAIFCATLDAGIFSTAPPGANPGLPLSANLYQAAAVFLNKNNQLRKIDQAGAIAPLLAPDPHAAQFLYDAKGRLLVTFYQPQRLADGNSYLLVRIDPITNSITGIDSSLTNMCWNLGSANPNVQLDYAGNVYYLAWANDGRLVLRRYSQDGTIKDLLNSDVEVAHWQARWDGAVVLAGRAVGSSTRWLKKISPDGTISDIASSVETGWIQQLPDNSLYAGFPYRGSAGLWGVYRLTQNLTPITSAAAQAPFIGDSQAGYTPEWDVRALVQGHQEAYCRALTEWSGGKMIGYADLGNDQAFALLGDAAFQTLVRLFPTPGVLELSALDRIEQIKAGRGLLVIYGSKGGTSKLIVYDPASGTEKVLAEGNIKIYQFDVTPEGHIIFDGLDLAANQVIIGIFKQSGGAIAGRMALGNVNYSYQELARLGGESERPLGFEAAKDPKAVSPRVAVAITAPESGAIIAGLVEVKALAASEGTLDRVEFYVDGALQGSDSVAPYGTLWDTALVPDGQHVLLARIYGAAGSISQNQIKVRVCNTSPGTMTLDKTRLVFGMTAAGLKTGSQTVLIGKTGGGPLQWTAIPSVPWINLQPPGGIDVGPLLVSVGGQVPGEGTYSGTVAVSDPAAFNSPQSIEIVLNVYRDGGSGRPFGFFDTPLDGSGVQGSVPVTGWALDGIGVESVKIYRDPVPNDPPGAIGSNNLVFIGNTFFIEGARPDVEQAYPTWPLCYKAGWGYMMLTNFLPNGGNGTFVIHAVATDKEGNVASLGTKTIVCDNANAVKPFGAIDTPTQGGTASGNPFYQFGWALTPQPKSIPTDGSTIWVFVDGVPLGHPSYNHFRDDIAALFPGYANSNGAVGVFNLDTTTYLNGVHNIAWSVRDSADQTSGIGSRFFNILNAGGSVGTQRLNSLAQIADIRQDAQTPVYVRRGFDLKSLAIPAYPGADGARKIEIYELERVAVYLNAEDARENEEEQSVRGKASIRAKLKRAKPIERPSRYEAYLVVGDELRLLPVGSTFDFERAVLYWQPGPGFLGEYCFMLIDRDEGTKRLFSLRIVPK